MHKIISKYLKQVLTELLEEIQTSVFIMGDSNSSLSVINKERTQNVYEDEEDLKSRNKGIRHWF